MNAKRFYSILAALLVYGLIIGGFIVFGESLDNKVKVLDVIVSCMIATQFVEYAIFPLVNLNNSAHKEIGMMGIHMASLNMCCTLSLALMIAGIAYDVPFKYQLIGQLAILLILILGRIAILHSGEKVEQIHKKETHTLAGKQSLRRSMDDLMDQVQLAKDVEEAERTRLTKIHESLRYITPSAHEEACHFDQQILQSLDNISVMVHDAKVNKHRIGEEIDRLEIFLARRKNY